MHHVLILVHNVPLLVLSLLHKTCT